ncbi:2'-5' RNA ligase family protein [Micromonospora ureilytica]|uniref:2'-5' RNA ligase family protein n=1 Tax=Micromonospora ureilytica TaxID=709868 RepID=UPI002E108B1A|nr:2'-5' RNA ligase family protein [Micromonospora ureilytica]
MEPTQTALIVPIPEAEEAVGGFRASLDPAASWGVPAHVTVLYPFLPPQRINEQALAVLRETFAEIPRFDVALTHVGWFGDAVVWLAPQPDRPFRDLTEAVWQRFSRGTPVRRGAQRCGAAPDHWSRRRQARVEPRRGNHLRSPADQRGHRQGPAHRRNTGRQPVATVREFPLGAPPAPAGTEFEVARA